MWPEGRARAAPLATRRRLQRRQKATAGRSVRVRQSTVLAEALQALIQQLLLLLQQLLQ